MGGVRARSEANHHLASKLRHKVWGPLCAATVILPAVVLGIRVAVQHVLSQDTQPLAAIGIASINPPKPVPSLAFADDTGYALSLTDFKGRAAVLNLWATWCVPCRQEMPALDRLQTKLGGSKLQVLAVSIDKQGAAVVQSFYRELGLRSLSIYLDPSGKAPSVLGVDGIPATLLIDAEGREVGRKLGVLEWDSPLVIAALQQAFGLGEKTP